MSKPRAIETEKLVSLHPDFAPVGQVKYATKEEAKLLIQIGRARYADNTEAKDGGYRHREMKVSQTQVLHRKGHK